MSRTPSPIFLERRRYRMRRLADLARMLPVVGAAGVLLPLLWGEGTATSGALIYLFGLWAVLIVVTAAISRALGEDGDADGTDETDPGPP